MIMIKTKNKIGKKLYQATGFLIEQLEEGEMKREEVYQLAELRGITGATITRARQVARVKAHRAGGIWYMYLPEGAPGGAREYFASCVREWARLSTVARATKRRRVNRSASSDWMTVITDSSERDDSIIPVPEKGSEGDAPIMPVREKGNGGLHVKVGAVEFTADSDFPTEKLVEVLRGLGVKSEC
jgi:hypothetical protein